MTQVHEQKVVQVSPAYPPATGYGGGPAVCEAISTELTERGHDVTVYTTVADDQGSTLPAGEEWRKGVKVHRLPLVSNRLTYRCKLFLARGFRSKLQSDLSGNEILHVHDLRTPLSIAAVKVANDRNIPLVLQPHGTVPRKERLVAWKRLFDLVWGRSLFASVDHWFALNREEVTALQQFQVDKKDISIVPNGIHLESIADPEDGAFRRDYDIPETVPMVLYLGRLHQSKRVGLLLEAIAHLDRDDVTLVIAGDDDGDEARLKKRAKSLNIDHQTRFVGRVSEQEKWAAFNDTDVFVTPSFYGFPLTFLEAMSQRTPVLATSSGDSLDEKPENGVYITNDTATDMAAELRQLLADRSQLRDVGNAAYNRVKTGYTWEQVVEKIEARYAKL